MPYFRYKLIERDGRPRSGLVDLPFENELSAMTWLERQGGTVLYARLLPGLMGAAIATVLALFQRRVQRSELKEALANLSVMLRAGVPVLNALQDTLVENDNPSLARVGRDLVMRIQGGASLSDALAFHQATFGDTVLFTVRLGEESGNLDRTLDDAAAHVAQNDRIARDIRGALYYPAFAFTAIFGALFFWIYFVTPTMIDLFVSLDVALPPLTLAVIATSEYLEQNALHLLLLGAAGVALVMAAVRSLPAVRSVWHALLLRTPLVGRIMQTYNIAFITTYLGLLNRSGVDAFRSFDLLSRAVRNEVYRRRLAEARDTLTQGNTIREALAQTRLFPPFVVRMIGVGEESGSLAEQFGFIADEYRDRLTRTVATIGKTVEPVAIGIGGALFILLAAALFLPIYQLIASVNV